MLRRILISLCGVILPATVMGRPLLTENVETVGRFGFEPRFSVSYRTDEFASPQSTYKSAVVPAEIRFGLTSKIDVGFSSTYISQRIESGDTHLSGARPGLFSSRLKVSPTDYLGFLFTWHASKDQKEKQELPIARGNDVELQGLFKLPVKWPAYFNLGYLHKGAYSSSLGVDNGESYEIEPGDIFEGRISLEVPVKYSVSLLAESACYYTDSKKIGGEPITDSDGTVIDALAGLTWSNKSWNIGAGVAFGLLDERLTSFDLERGAGDTLYKVQLSYLLTPKRPGR